MKRPKHSISNSVSTRIALWMLPWRPNYVDAEVWRGKARHDRHECPRREMLGDQLFRDTGKPNSRESCGDESDMMARTLGYKRRPLTSQTTVGLREKEV